MAVIQIITYAMTAAFVIAVVSRFIRLARLPMHVRWELYPVAHEKGRSHYGGSYLEELDWWTKKRQTSKLGELKVMVPEILLLAGVWEHNKKHWFRTFPFHFGLYLLIGLIVMLMAGGIFTMLGTPVTGNAGGLAGILFDVTNVVGYLGLFMAMVGSAALLYRRTFDVAYREYTRKSDYVNLVFFTVALGVAIASRFTADPHFHGIRSFFAHFLTFDLGWGEAGLAGARTLVGAEILLAALLIAYIPLTHMSHFFTKYFMYHDIRWSDEPNLRGGAIERKMAEPLNYPVSWAGKHIGADGKKTWVDVATADIEETEK